MSLVLLLVLALFVALGLAGASRPRTEIRLPANCTAIVIGQMYVCPPLGHAFAHGDRGGWRDVGAFRPEPILVPTLPER